MTSATRWILIVEDDPVLLQMLSDFIRGPQIRVTTASDALHAFIQARDLKPALIISDMQMPGFYGSATLAELRKDPDLSRIPIIFVTGMNPREGGVAFTGEGRSYALNDQTGRLAAIGEHRDGTDGA